METLEAWSCSSAVAGGLEAATAGGGPLFTLAVQALLAAQCAFVHPSQHPTDRTADILNGKTEFDFIVVGAGSAGSVVASRLSEVGNWDVLLIEAGGDPSLLNEIPLLFYNNMDTKTDWKYITESSGMCKGTIDGGCRWPRGRVLGGSSAINAMFYIRGNMADYDEWERLGNRNWRYEKVLEYFKKSENFKGDEEYYEKNKKYHAKGGYLNVEKFNFEDHVANWVIQANKEIGIEEGYDPNGSNQIGVFEGFGTVKDGRRMSASRAFLDRVKDRKNLYIIKNALVMKVNIENKAAKGVEAILNNGEAVTLNVKKEVVISGGSINTPQLLLLSGVGPEEHLKEMGIDVEHNLPVGENLQDHIVAPVFFDVKKGILKQLSQLEIGAAYAHYLTKGLSPFGALLTAKVTQFLNVKNETSLIPNIQYHFIPFLPDDTILLDTFFNGHAYNEDATESVRKLNKESFILMVYTTLLEPKSRGRIVLKSKDGKVYPKIFPNYYAEEEDLNTMIRGMEAVERLEDTTVFKNEKIKLIKLDYKPCARFELRTDPYRKCIAEHYGFTLYHPVGTAKMGPKSDPTSVVDDKLRVHGIQGLRAADASIMPVIVRGNTNAPTIMIGEKASDFIKEQWLEKHDEL